MGDVENNKKKLSREKLYNLLVGFYVDINYLLAGKGEMFIQTPEERIKAEGQNRLNNLPQRLKNL